MSAKRAQKHRQWRWLFRGRLQAMLEQHDDGVHVFIGTRDCGTFSSEAAAERFVEKLTADRQGDNGR